MLQCKTKWKKKKLGNLGYTYSGLSNKTIDDFGSGEDFIPYMNIYKNSIIKIDKFEQVKIGLNEHQNQVQSGDVFFTTSSETPEEVGLTSVLIDRIDKPLYLNSFCFGFRLNDNNEFNNTFLAYLLRGESVRLQISKMAQGSTRYNLSKTQLLNKLNLYYPNDKNEQEKISRVLSTCDEVIEKTEETIEKYKQIKAGMMQDLFTRGLDANGKLRPTYTQAPDLYKYSKELDRYIPKAWDVDKLDNLFTYTVGGDVDKPCFSEYKTSLHKYPIFANAVDKEGLYGYSSNFVIDRPAITIAGRGVNIGTVFYRDAFFTPIVRLVVAFPNECLDILFASIALSRIKFESEATGIPQLTVPMVKKYKMAYPIKKDEQHNIYKYLNKIDLKLRKEEQYLNKYKQIKQGLMKRLLTPPADAEIVEE